MSSSIQAQIGKMNSQPECPVFPSRENEIQKKYRGKK